MVLIDLLLSVLLALLVTSLGRVLFRVCRFSFASFGEEAIFSFGLGLGVLAYLTFFAGILGWLYRNVFYVSFLLLIVLLRREILDTAKSALLPIRRFSFSSFSSVTLVLGSILFFALIMNLIGSIAPPTEADTLAYHFAYPKLFVREHRIFYIPDFVANAPLNQHMLYIIGMLLHRSVMASLIVYMEGIALVAAIILFCRKYLSTEIGVLSAVLLYTTPLLTYMAGSGLVELGLTLFTFLAFWAFYEWILAHKIRWLTVAAIFTGFAAGTKYYGLISIVAFGLLIGLHLTLHQGFVLKDLVRALTLFGFIVIMIGSPWYIRNAVNTGNPVYPAFYSILGGRDWSPELNDAFKSMVAKEKRRGGNDLISFVLAPWNMTIKGDLFGAARTGFGPVFLAFAPLVIWLFCINDQPARPLLGYIILFAFIFFTIWFWIAFQRHRHLLPIMPGMSIGTAMAIFYIGNRSRLMKWAVSLAVAVALFFNLGGNLIFNAHFVPVVFGAQSKESFLKSKVPGYEDIIWINEHLRDEDKILHFGRVNNFHLDVSYYFGSTVSQGRINWARIKSVEELILKLKAEGITHLWINEKGLADLARNSPNVINHVSSINHRMAKLLLQLAEDHTREIYRSDRIVPKFRLLDRGKQEVSSRIYRIASLD